MNDSGRKILREAGLNFVGTYVHGYSDYYLNQCWNDSKKINEADPTVYQRLVDIDSTLGTEPSDQLIGCLWRTTRWDIIKVFEFPQIKNLKLF